MYNSNNLPEKSETFDLKKKKENIICSLKEVECFLNDFHKLVNYIKLYNILK